MSIDLASELRVMVGNAPATRSYVTDLYTRAADEIEALRARLEKAEAERDALKALAERQLGQMIEKAAQARNDALEEAAQVVKNEPMRFAGQTESYVRASLSSAIRALKDKS
jgi:light-regulated signal transduction histidine kinase (bacteriophytochrome)